MKHAEKLAPVAAVASAVSCMACCLPLGIAAAAGLAGVAAVLEPVRGWLMAIAAGLLTFGLWQLYRKPRVCKPRSRVSVAIFWSCAVVVALVTIAPQLVAGWLADL